MNFIFDKKRRLLTLLLLFACVLVVRAQSPYLGAQNSPRKSMISSVMNPAEINNLSKNIEINIFSINGSFNSNTLIIGDIFQFGTNVLGLAFQNATSPINMRTDATIIGPSVGIRSGKWAFGFSTQAILKADIVDLNPTLGQSLLNFGLDGTQNITSISSNNNQRLNAAGWAEMGFIVGREIINTEKHRFTVGVSTKLFFPGTYANFGLDKLNAVIIQDDSGVNLTEAAGTVNLSYSEKIFNGISFGFGSNKFNFGKVNGFGFDFGGNYQLKDVHGGSKLNLGLSVKNQGRMTFADGHIDNTYTINIPKGQFFNLDQLLINDLNEIEEAFLTSGFFTKTTQMNGLKTKLPSIVSGYAEIQFLKNLYVSAYGQLRTGNIFSNETITAQNIFVITPRFILGDFEVYSPWSKAEVSGYAGGLGLRYGGFFLGSNSILTGLNDFHFGLS